MATKQTALRNAKQAKRRNSAKERTKKANLQQQTIKHKQAKEYKQKTLMQEIAAKGPVETARKIYRKGKGKGTTTKLTNKVVIENIAATIVACTKQHSGVEVFTRLGEEKLFVIQPVEQELIDMLDKQIVQLCENINAITIFVEAGKEPDEYMELFVDYTQLLAQMTEETFPLIIDMLQPKGELLDNYYNEHVNGRAIFDYMTSLHFDRMKKVADKYATRIGKVELDHSPLHSYTPTNEQPSDPMIDDDIEDATLVEEPNLLKDVETINQ